MKGASYLENIRYLVAAQVTQVLAEPAVCFRNNHDRLRNRQGL